ncbi:RNA-binding domain-containing protein [Gloeophyllum trabeum ATCC 11539]|uniref:RNA-binding domain-containing protein n=1 Tax=Gloeophyllum trabeum (strain ATCC 11539 / FP-39264 / Madison 617) TaxID=670483 RepID=S7RVY6_GLOTA|nr:RNA-binding domain-containing protein [Gloeophyllum trabeum ATCC 11539]EPQ58985.1 RNA-binding domain-containing protein [Gloeophyllum trabeum ATCC 11539]
MSSSAGDHGTQPNNTLYINNLNDKVNKEELRHQLFALFTTYGKVIDVVAQKGAKMRGQAFLVFSDLAGATAAMRACEGMVFYDKPMRIHYAKSKSYATLRREDPNFIPPVAAAVHNATLASDKRAREDDMNVDERASKKEKADDEDGEEMEIEDDEEGGSKQAVPPAVSLPSARLLCTNLPQEVTDDVLSVLFQQYQGFQSTHVVPAPQPNAAGQKVKMAQVLFDSPELATVAKEALDGFTLKKGWIMSVAYI